MKNLFYLFALSFCFTSQLRAQARADTNSSASFEMIYMLENRSIDQLSYLAEFPFEDTRLHITGGFAFRIKSRSILARIFALRGMSSEQSVRHSSVGLQVGYEYAFADHWSTSFLSGFRLENGKASHAVDTSGIIAPGYVPNVREWNYQLHYIQNQLNLSYWFAEGPLPFLMPKSLTLGFSYGFAINPSQFWFTGQGDIPQAGVKAFGNIWQVSIRMEWYLTN